MYGITKIADLNGSSAYSSKPQKTDDDSTVRHYTWLTRVGKRVLVDIIYASPWHG